MMLLHGFSRHSGECLRMTGLIILSFVLEICPQACRVVTSFALCLLSYNEVMSSIFSKIIAGEIPSYTIYEDEKIFAFLTIQPNTLGHTLVVPKKEIGNFMDVSDDLFNHMMTIGKNTLAPAIQKAT